MKKVLIHDAHNASWRSMKQLPVLTSGGKPTQVVYGVLKLLRASIEEFEPNAVIVCWDTGYSKFRKDIYSEYKGNRNHEKDEESAREYKSFCYQVGVLKKILPLLNVVQLYHKENEADDLIAIVVDSMPKYKKTVISTDRDMIQLVDGMTEVYSPHYKKPQIYNVDNFNDVIGLSRKQYIELRAITGDSGDNIPGAAKGIGEVTAKKLLKQYGSLAGIWTNKKEISKQKRCEPLFTSEAKRAVHRNLLLMDLSIAGEANPDIEEIRKLLWMNWRGRDGVKRKTIKRFFIKHSFNSILAQFQQWMTPFESLDIYGNMNA